MKQVLAIFDENQSFLGIWSAEDEFSAHCLLGLEELWGPTLRAFSNPEILRFIPNDSVDVGNKIRLDGGIFVMMPNDKAPNEELSDPGSTVAYRLVRFDGVSCRVLMRARCTDPCITTPPRGRLKQTGQAEVVAQDSVQTSGVPAKASGGRERAHEASATAAEPTRPTVAQTQPKAPQNKWWEFWK
jgi:hypothetical protein